MDTPNPQHDASSAAAAAPLDGERPRGPDRRQRATPMLSRYSFFGGRRRAGRRDGEIENVYVDMYSPRLTALLLIFFALTVADSVLTLVYLGKGGREFNPVAQWMIDQGAVFFVLFKGVLSGLCLLFVMLHKNFKPARLALGIGFGFYFLLGVYHLVLQVLAMQG
ncbi:MAG: hypothetical protein DHS20C15_16740 [Planctomycetota bacterium]|nr:MAG: hypothetical protein DHS20C15_16740 [Planctomycetota bacterium]